MNARRNLIPGTLTAVLLAPIASAQAPTAPADRPHKVVFQVRDADPAKWSLALNNARNVQQNLGHDKVAIEIVAHGPGCAIRRSPATICCPGSATSGPASCN